jgi:hypothetical protein
MEIIDIAVILHDVLNELLAEDDKVAENLGMFRNKLAKMIDKEL